ncbi:winged helix-turn-helix transcriptional regulator [Streptomyces cavernae]|uniref:winged helix-turn-helix transcriptional regulator n=1 Tax=Streptomyces cavernae TaxID=2259034 RepID=UPI001EE40DFF|nr:AsnC family transcriptional regulator [Streptomyces cavernae]
MSAPVHLDSVDLQILELLRADGRRIIRDIARLVKLSPAPVRRRIARLEDSGVITGTRSRRIRPSSVRAFRRSPSCVSRATPTSTTS